ncbi:hypothetical protein JAAARDRAFT_45911 [Jaapia argillacea MUCL 33604]|uniref:Uncharacterized protein n=1 Tax=Jaapia argillacea MUCL 33604 TaxID=933084 RepID=A0A067PYZ2_9AGAM|nr:hypothetical protein JAAARDRAFT_45911 [Jaapia argillacea MUCL 33604]
MAPKTRAPITKAVTASTPSQEPAKRKCKPSAKADNNNPDSDNNPVEPQADDEEGGRLIVKWDGDEAKLSWSMIGAISDDPVIKRGLFPPEGPNQRRNGGKTKTEHYWAGLPKDKTVWCNKIKNRLSKMTEITRKGNTILRETGAGIMKAEQINMTDDNTFTDKWSRFSALECYPSHLVLMVDIPEQVWDELKAPWYFEMRELIAQCPNLVPTGLGNSQSDFDFGVVIPGTGGEDLTISDTTSGVDDQGFGDSSEGHEDGEQSDLGQEDGGIEVTEVKKSTGLAMKPSSTLVVLSDDSSESEIEFGAAVTKKPKTEGARASMKPPLTAAPQAPKKTPACPGVSAPAPPQKTKKMKGIADFEQIALLEEKTRQMQLDLQKTKAIKKLEVDIKKIDAKKELKQVRLRQQLELKTLQMKHLHLLQMARLQSSLGQTGPSVAGPSQLPNHSLSTPDWHVHSHHPHSQHSIPDDWPSMPNTPYSLGSHSNGSSSYEGNAVGSPQGTANHFGGFDMGPVMGGTSDGNM